MDETVPSASLLHHLKLSLNSTSMTAYLFLLGGNTVVFYSSKKQSTLGGGQPLTWPHRSFGSTL